MKNPVDEVPVAGPCGTIDVNLYSIRIFCVKEFLRKKESDHPRSCRIAEHVRGRYFYIRW